MPFTVTMPKLSPTMQEGTITKWHKKIGQKVESGELLIEVATDKATVEYNALDEGFLAKILIPEGALAIVNQPIAIFTQKPNENIENYIPEGLNPVTETSTTEEKNIQAADIKAPLPIPTPTFQPLFTPEPPLEHYEFEFPSNTIPKRIPASPLAKKLAKQKGLDLTTVKGSGPGGRIISDDLNLAQSDQIVTFGRREKPTIQPGTFEEIPLTPMRKVIAQRLQQAKSSIPHIYVHQEIDPSALVEAREHLKNGNLKVSINDFVIRAVALALKEHPHCNSGFNTATQSIILFKTIDISVAVSVDGGLITPIIRHADYKNIGEISLEMKELSARAKLGKLAPEEYKGGSFTISNMGMYGITDFCAIINPPQAGILAVGGIEECPRVKNGHIVVGKKMHLVLSVDHRVIDGAEAAQWIKTVQKYLENPTLLTI
jgi:pyruvate dehydrogenase E2 component (dihydrolipoamide acetyltransferase)